MNLLDSLKRSTTVVADTGDFESIAEYRPKDATTNPSLIYQAAQKPHYQHLVDEALDFTLRSPGDTASRSAAFMDKLFITFGCEILKIVPGRVSTEVDAGLSFDTEGTVAKARKLIGMYPDGGIERERVLIKIASHHPGSVTCACIGRSRCDSRGAVDLSHECRHRCVLGITEQLARGDLDHRVAVDHVHPIGVGADIWWLHVQPAELEDSDSDGAGHAVDRERLDAVAELDPQREPGGIDSLLLSREPDAADPAAANSRPGPPAAPTLHLPGKRLPEHVRRHPLFVGFQRLT